MSRRTTHGNDKVYLLKNLSRSSRATKGKLLPRGFRHVVINDQLYLENLKTGATTPVGV